MFLLLAGCVSGLPQQETYTSKSGKVTVIQTDREQCETACNNDYERCMDTRPAQTNPVPGSPPGMFGAASDCRANLKSCLQDCKIRQFNNEK